MDRAHTYLPPPTACERLETICARAGGTVTVRVGSVAGSVNYALPVHATEEVREFLGWSATAEGAAEMVARIPGGRVFGPGNVLSPDGGCVARDVSPDFGKTFAEHWLLSYQKIRPPQRLGGTVAVVATPLGAGYAHWLLEELPRWLALGRDAGGAQKILAHAKAPFARDTVALVLRDWPGEVIEPARLSHYVCEELVVPNLPGREGWPTPGVVERIGEWVAPWAAAGASPRGERIYVSRENARRRRVVNEAELWAQLQARGFVKVRPEELTWREQIAAFRHAKAIVAPHGAGLANVMFCSGGVRVVEFFNRSYVNGLFWRLAALKGLDYRPVMAAGDEPLAQIAARGRDDIFADVAAVVRAAG